MLNEVEEFLKSLVGSILSLNLNSENNLYNL